MSYILEALRRSQADRERGQVPGLNAQPAAVAARPRQPEGGPWRGWLPAGLAGLAVVAALVATVLWFWRTPAALPAVAPAPAPAPALAPLPAPAVTPRPAPLPVVVSAPPAPVPVQVPLQVPVQAQAQAQAPGPGPGPAVLTPVPLPAPAAQSTAPAPRTVRLADLSAEQRRELPTLSMGGSVWSESALSRFVIVNGQVVREGDTAAPGVVVDRIGPKAVLLRWRELRLEVPI